MTGKDEQGRSLWMAAKLRADWKTVNGYMPTHKGYDCPRADNSALLFSILFLSSVIRTVIGQS